MTDRKTQLSPNRYPDRWLSAPARYGYHCRIVSGPNMNGYYKIAFKSPDGPWEDTRYVKKVRHAD